jgi:hypothetical protein
MPGKKLSFLRHSLCMFLKFKIGVPESDQGKLRLIDRQKSKNSLK